MKVLLINGSPNQKGCTNRALEEVAAQLQVEGLETEIFWIGKKPVGGCMACESCRKLGRCVVDDVVNAALEKLMAADALVVGAPVHYGSPAGSVIGFLDRLFYSTPRAARYLKPAAAVVTARRAGNTASFDVLNKYFTISEMPVISSCYWNMVHGNTPQEVEQDAEGLRTMRVLGRNLAYFLRCREAANAAGIPLPETEPSVYTNFVRET